MKNKNWLGYLIGAVLVVLAIFIGIDLLNGKSTSGNPDTDQPCAQVVTEARNPATGEVREFPTPCDVPDGWEKTDPAAETLGDGSHYVLISSVKMDGTRRMLEVDKVEIAAGGRDQAPFTNKDKESNQVELSSTATVVMQTLTPVPGGEYKFDEKITAARFFQVFDGSSKERFHFEGIPFLVTVKDGKVTSISEKYVP